MQIAILIFFLIQLFGQVFSPLVGPTEDDALVDDEFGVYFVDGFHFFPFVQEHVVMSESDQH